MTSNPLRWQTGLNGELFYYGDQGVEDYTPARILPRDTTFAEDLREKVVGWGVPRDTAERIFGGKIYPKGDLLQRVIGQAGLAGVAPWTGGAMMVGQAAYDVNKGNYGDAMLNAGLGLLDLGVSNSALRSSYLKDRPNAGSALRNLTADEIGAGRAISRGDMDLLREVVQSSGTPQSVGAARVGGSVIDPLIAHHNLSSQGVRVSSDIGGIPMPSLAISRADYPLENFGDITLLADPSMVTPSGKMGVWNADVYTGRQPRGEVVPADVKQMAAALGEDRAFSHFKDVKDLLDPRVQDFDRSNQIVKWAQAGVQAGIDPKDFTSIRDYARAVSNKFGYQSDQILDQHAGLESYGDTRRVLPTYTGRRKPKEYTIDNVLAEMKRDKAFNPSTESNSFGPAQFRAVSADKMKNLSQIKAGRGQILPKADTEKAFQMFNDDHWDLSNRISNELGVKIDTAQSLMHDVSSGENYVKWFGKRLPDDIIDEIKTLKSQAAELPTDYFEAKARGAVKLSDFPAAIVPETATEAQDLLRQAGIKQILTYGTPEQRKELFKKVPELLFSVGGFGLLGAYGATANNDKGL